MHDSFAVLGDELLFVSILAWDDGRAGVLVALAGPRRALEGRVVEVGVPVRVEVHRRVGAEGDRVRALVGRFDAVKFGTYFSAKMIKL